MTRARKPRSAARLIGAYASVTLVPVLVLGAVLASTYRSEARRRGVAEGQAEAALVANTAVEPVLDGHSLDRGLTVAERLGENRETIGETRSRLGLSRDAAPERCR